MTHCKWLGRTAAVARVEILRLLNDRTSLSLILVVPALQMLLFGFAINPDPRHVALVIARDLPAGESGSDEFAQGIAASGYFDLAADGLKPGEAARRVASGAALLGIEWHSGSNGASPGLQIIADASDPTAVRPALLALQSALTRAAGQALTGMSATTIDVQWLYNPEQRSAWGIAPGLAGVVVMITMLMLGALTLVKEREQGSWTSLLATPITALEAMLGKLAPYLILAVLQAAAVIGVAHLWLQLPLRGDLGALLAAALLLAAAHLTLGFALSAVAENQLQAVQGAVFFYLPSILLSGFMFPFAGMPTWAQAIGNVLPLTHFVRAARGVLLRGQGVHFVMTQMWPVALFAIGTSVLAVLCYRRRLD